MKSILYFAVFILILLSGCTARYAPKYNDTSFQNSTTTLALQVQSKDSDFLNVHKVYIGDGVKVNGYIDTQSGRKRILSNKSVYLTIEYIHLISKIVTYKHFTLHTQSNKNYVILIELEDQNNMIYLKESRAGKLKDVDMDRIELR